MTREDLIKLIQDEEAKGNIVFETLDGLCITPMEEFLKQDVKNILYDLNRDTATCLRLIDHQGWINNYACNRVITKLKEMLEK